MMLTFGFATRNTACRSSRARTTPNQEERRRWHQLATWRQDGRASRRDTDRHMHQHHVAAYPPILPSSRRGVFFDVNSVHPLPLCLNKGCRVPCTHWSASYSLHARRRCVCKHRDFVANLLRVSYQVGSRRLPWRLDGRELCLAEDVMT